MKTTEFWAGPEGDAYIERNRYDWRDRVEFWQSAIEYTTPATVFEFGCNVGLNLEAIASISPNLDLYGVDVNLNAVNEARAKGFEVQHVEGGGVAGVYEPGTMDLVFSAGVLIHIPPENLRATMQSLVQLAGRYVVAVEYFAEREEEVVYREKKGLLWKRPYGKLYQDLGLRLLSEGVAGGFNECAYWLLEKPQ
jgi:pseudaminic acid biosynthesis-associated methylase